LKFFEFCSKISISLPMAKSFIFLRERCSSRSIPAPASSAEPYSAGSRWGSASGYGLLHGGSSYLLLFCASHDETRGKNFASYITRILVHNHQQLSFAKNHKQICGLYNKKKQNLSWSCRFKVLKFFKTKNLTTPYSFVFLF